MGSAWNAKIYTPNFKYPKEFHEINRSVWKISCKGTPSALGWRSIQKNLLLGYKWSDQVCTKNVIFQTFIPVGCAGDGGIGVKYQNKFFIRNLHEISRFVQKNHKMNPYSLGVGVNFQKKSLLGKNETSRSAQKKNTCLQLPHHGIWGVWFQTPTIFI